MRSRPARISALLIVAALASAACQPSEGACGLLTCDVRNRGCQAMAARAAACLLGRAPVETPVALVTRQRLLAEAVTGAGQGDVEAAQRRLQALALIDLADPDVTPENLAIAQNVRVGAYYDGQAKQITIVTSGNQALDTVFDVSVLVHEFTHALQDVAGRLPFPLADGDDSYDRFQARGVLVEGEASLTESLATLSLYERSGGDVPWSALFTRLHDLSERFGASAPVPLDLAYSNFVYPYGLSTVYPVFAAGGAPAVDQLWSMPPVTAGQVIAGTSAATAPALEDLGPDAVPVLPAPFSVREGDRLGAFVWKLFLLRSGTRVDLPRSEATRLAAGLRGDFFTRAEGNGPLVTWRLRFATPPLAEEVTAHLTRLNRTGWTISRLDRDVVVVAQRSDAAPVAITGWRARPGPMPRLIVPPARCTPSPDFIPSGRQATVPPVPR